MDFKVTVPRIKPYNVWNAFYKILFKPFTTSITLYSVPFYRITKRTL